MRPISLCRRRPLIDEPCHSVYGCAGWHVFQEVYRESVCIEICAQCDFLSSGKEDEKLKGVGNKQLRGDCAGFCFVFKAHQGAHIGICNS
jgi:hypothetical protein